MSKSSGRIIANIKIHSVEAFTPEEWALVNSVSPEEYEENLAESKHDIEQHIRNLFGAIDLSVEGNVFDVDVEYILEEVKSDEPREDELS